MSKKNSHTIKRKVHRSGKLIYGVGVNDADYVVNPTVDGKLVRCPFYVVWTSMLQRCYDPKYHIKQPTYIGCTVCPDWYYFSNFKAWMQTQNWEGKQLDKDIIDPNNKAYAPDKCVFVPHAINNLLTDRAAKRGSYPIGVSWHRKRFRACCNDGSGTQKLLGLFDTPEDAHQAYIDFKTQLITTIANQQVDTRIREGLLLHAKLLRESDP